MTVNMKLACPLVLSYSVGFTSHFEAVWPCQIKVSSVTGFVLCVFLLNILIILMFAGDFLQKIELF